MEISNEQIYLTIEEYETLTAGRFYTDTQRKRILDLVSLSNLLTANEQLILEFEIFEGETKGLYSYLDCANSLLLLSNLPEKSYKKTILLKRIQTYQKLLSKADWLNREQWITHIGTNQSLLSSLDSAIILYALGDIKKAISKLSILVENNYLLAIKLSIALLMKLNYVTEAKSLAKKYQQVMNNLYFVDCTNKFKFTYGLKTPQIIDKEVDNLKYFNENTFYKRKIGFEVK